MSVNTDKCHGRQLQSAGMKKPRKQSPRQITDETAEVAFAPLVKALVGQPLKARQPADPPGFVRGARVRKP